MKTTPFPSVLILGMSAGRPLHVVAANNKADDETIIITVYEPDADAWELGFQKEKVMKCFICRHGETRPARPP